MNRQQCHYQKMNDKEQIHEKVVVTVVDQMTYGTIAL